MKETKQNQALDYCLHVRTTSTRRTAAASWAPMLLHKWVVWWDGCRESIEVRESTGIVLPDIEQEKCCGVLLTLVSCCPRSLRDLPPLTTLLRYWPLLTPEAGGRVVISWLVDMNWHPARLRVRRDQGRLGSTRPGSKHRLGHSKPSSLAAFLTDTLFSSMDLEQATPRECLLSLLHWQLMGAERRAPRNMCIYIYIYIYIHICMYIYIYIYVYTYIYIYIYICLFLASTTEPVLARAARRVSRRSSAYIYIYICVCISLSLSIYIYIYILERERDYIISGFIYIYIYIYTYIVLIGVSCVAASPGLMALDIPPRGTETTPRHVCSYICTHYIICTETTYVHIVCRYICTETTPRTYVNYIRTHYVIRILSLYLSLYLSLSLSLSPSFYLPPSLSLSLYIYIYIYTHYYCPQGGAPCSRVRCGSSATPSCGDNMCINIYIYIYIHTHIHMHIICIEREILHIVCTCIHTMCVYIYIHTLYVYTYIYIYRERERDRLYHSSGGR